MTAVKIVFANGQWIVVFLTVDEANQMISDWIESKLPTVFGRGKPLPGQPSVAWAVRTSDIIALHTVDAAELQALAQGQGSVPVQLQPVPAAVSGRQDILRQW